MIRMAVSRWARNHYPGLLFLSLPNRSLPGLTEGKERETELLMMVQTAEGNPVRHFGGNGDYASLNYGWWSKEHEVYATVRRLRPRHLVQPEFGVP